MFQVNLDIEELARELADFAPSRIEPEPPVPEARELVGLRAIN